ncbi:MAG TPA: hypothetical protein VKZ42_00560 [Flavobacteriaceae bacterium]|nr:hypothetical protein [Flavobacteriaceae bacterium]
MRVMVICCIFLLCYATNAQVGINTTNPSNASVLEIKSSSDNLHFGGFLLPKVTLSQRDLIPVGAGDDGMLVFVMDGDNRCLQIYNEGQNIWMNVFCYQIVTPEYKVLASWEMTGLTDYGPSPFDPEYTDVSVVAGGLTRGAGITTAGASPPNDAWGGTGWSAATNRDEAILEAEFVTFTLGPVVGETISISAILPYNIRRSGTGPTHGIWQYSTDGVNFTDIGTSINWGSVTSGAGNPQDEIDLSIIPELQNISYPEQITFRIVCWGATNNLGRWYINNKPDMGDLIIVSDY